MGTDRKICCTSPILTSDSRHFESSPFTITRIIEENDFVGKRLPSSADLNTSAMDGLMLSRISAFV